MIVSFLIADGAEQKAVLHITGDDGGAVLAPLHDVFQRVELQLSLQFVGFKRMAVVTVVREQRLDLLLKQRGRIRAPRRTSGKQQE